MDSAYSVIPPKAKILSGSLLKLIALVSMLIDHTASVLLRNDTTVLLRIGSRSLTLYTAMRTVGRLAFPLYAFLLVEGFFHTRDRLRYGLRLLLFALISEIPWNLEHTGTLTYASQNVFFTLFLGFLGLWLLEDIKNDEKNKVRDFILLILLLAASVLLKADYGCSGFGFILLLYLLRDMPICRAVTGACFLSSTWKAGLAFIPIALYNGKRGFIQGKLLSLFFYLLYPLHMLLLYVIRLKTTGY
ncbi:MAG: TraX protein [Lachnospiraceae bacterium]|nr:TraX protein [Lachnospiraceae bacterium]